MAAQKNTSKRNRAGRPWSDDPTSSARVLHIPRSAKASAPPRLPAIGSESIPPERHSPNCWCSVCFQRRGPRSESASESGPVRTDPDGKGGFVEGPHAFGAPSPPPDPFREKVDACTKAIAELASFLLSSARPNRFSEASRVALLARQLVISTASRAKDLALNNGLGAGLAYPVMGGGGGVVEMPIFGDNEPAIGARAAGWADALGGPAGFQNPNDGGINQRDALLSLMTSMQAQGDQARANARRAIAGEVADLTRLREELAEGIWKMTQDPKRATTPADASRLAEDRRRLAVIDKRVERLFNQIAADPADTPPAPAPAPIAPIGPGDFR